MAGQLIPPPELAPSVPKGLTSEQLVSMWMDLTDACEELLRAGLRDRIGPLGDLEAAYQEWDERRYEEHVQAMIHMMKELVRREKQS